MRFTKLVTLAFLLGCTYAKQVLVDLTSSLESNDIIEADLNDDVQIKLKSNPSTGFSWVMVNRVTNDLQTLDLVKEEYVPDHQAEDELYGAGGTKYYNFKAIKEG